MSTRRRRRWPLLVGVGLAAIAVAAFWTLRIYDPGWRYDVQGVDVSHHQGEIDWPVLAAEGVGFAYIKATEGGDWTDPRFRENWSAAAAAAIPRGAYHYFTLCRSGAEQAAHFVATVPIETGMLPPAVDLEFGGNCSARPPVETLRAELAEFLSRIEAHYQVKPVVYTNPDFYGQYLADAPPDGTWWMLSPLWEPWGDPEWTFWQYLPGGSDSVDGAIDRNVFRGSLADLEKLAVP